MNRPDHQAHPDPRAEAVARIVDGVQAKIAAENPHLDPNSRALSFDYKKVVAIADKLVAQAQAAGRGFEPFWLQITVDAVAAALSVVDTQVNPPAPTP